MEDGKEIQPSLIHGDLRSGNIGSADGKPSIFDPAVYWGHHEAEWGVSMEQTIVGLPFLHRCRCAMSLTFMETNHSYATDVMVRRIWTSVLGRISIAHSAR
jgi:hypothetical protein